MLLTSVLISCFVVNGYHTLSQVRKYLKSILIVMTIFFYKLAKYARAQKVGKDCGKDASGTCRNAKYAVDKIVRDGHYWNSNTKNDKPYLQV